MNGLFTSLIAFLLLSNPLMGQLAVPCQVLLNDGTCVRGETEFPQMFEKKLLLFLPEGNDKMKIESQTIREILFPNGNDTLVYKFLIAPKRFSNGKGTRRLWLREDISGNMSLYYGFNEGKNAPGVEAWYCKKSKDSVVYFLTMKYVGGAVVTFGTKKTFRKNISVYFKDSPDLVIAVEKDELTYTDLPEIVDKYNSRH